MHTRQTLNPKTNAAFHVVSISQCIMTGLLNTAFQAMNWEYEQESYYDPPSVFGSFKDSDIEPMLMPF